MNTSDTTSTPPLGFWLRAVDALIDRAFAEALAAEDVSRRDWMLLTVIAGDIDAPWLAARLAQRRGRVRRLIDRGWVAESSDGLSLTDEGRAAQERLGSIVETVRARVSGAVSPEDFATTLASLEAIARELGWDENSPLDRGRGKHRRFGFGPGPRGFGFGPASRGFGRHGHGFDGGFGPHAGFGRGFAPHAGFGPGAWPGGAARDASDDTAFERGFTAGFAQGRAAGAPGDAS
ncbi:MarR family winged helix-turn-helix transcriptional regulator [Microbacterium sp. RD1]|uniref:MarR family winged helix-turn-helix transcriptional regulator n=1 Tax=Microbacterium sp. RD1 TaxID=3457313 RepID=UPI003FA54820